MENYIVWIIAFAIGLVGVIVGAILVSGVYKAQQKYYERRDLKRDELKRLTEEIETLILLNNKINEILLKRNIFLPEYLSFDAFDDCYISIDDYVFIQSFTAQNHFLLPSYLVEEFFKNIAVRRAVMSPEETTAIGGYTFKGGRLLLEQFSDKLIAIVEDRKIALKQEKSKLI